MEVGGLVKVIPVAGLTIGITLRVLAEDDCWKFIWAGLPVTPEWT